MTLPASRLAPLNTSPLALNSVRADSDCSSSADESPKTPSSSMTLSGSPPSPRISKLSTTNPSAFNMSSLSCSSSSSSSQEDLLTSMRDEKEDMEPVFTTIPTRRARSSGTIARTPAGGLSFTTINGTTCSAESVSPISRRTPSFPVSRPIRPFDSISNAMGTQPKRVSPTTEAPFAAAAASKTHEVIQKSNAPKAAEPAQLDSKPKPWRSSKLLEPPKNNRFQNGFFILDMTQDEFKSRAW